MLIQPPSSEPLRVLAIDPGTTTMGISQLEWGFGTNRYKVNTAFTLRTVNPKWDSPYFSMGELHGNRTARIIHLADELRKTVFHYRPHVVITETPYMGKFAEAFEALVETLWMIRSVMGEYDPHLPLYGIDPTTAKKAVGVTIRRGMDKEDVRQALLARQDVDWGIDPKTLDEHSIDATAVGLYYLIGVV